MASNKVATCNEKGYQDYLARKKSRQKAKTVKSSLDFEFEIKQILETGTEKKYPKSEISPDERMQFSLLAEQQGLASYGDLDVENNIEYLIISPSKDDHSFDLNALEPHYLHRFSAITQYVFSDPVTFLDDVKLLNQEKQLELFVNDLVKYGYAGLKRRDEIVGQQVVKYIQSLPGYWTMIKQDIALLPGPISPPWTIANHLYNPSSNGQVFISIDLNAAIFRSYVELGIISEQTWSEFMKRFTKSQLLIEMKSFRSKIFGKLDKQGRHTILINNSILKIWNRIRDKFQDKLIAIEGDEILLQSSNYRDELDQLKILLEDQSVKISCFRTKYVHTTDLTYYIREFLQSNTKTPFDIKGIDRTELVSAMRHAKTLEK